MLNMFDASDSPMQSKSENANVAAAKKNRSCSKKKNLYRPRLLEHGLSVLYHRRGDEADSLYAFCCDVCSWLESKNSNVQR